MKAKVYLSGEELKAHHLAETLALELAAKQQTMLDRSRRMMNDDEADSSDSESEIELEPEAVLVEEAGVMRRRIGGFTGGVGAWDEFLIEENGVEGGERKPQFDIYVKTSYLPRSISTPRSSVQRYRTYPVVERKRRVDAYGEAIDVEGWLRRGLEDSGAREVRTGAGGAVVLSTKRTREEEEEEVRSHSFHLFLVDQQGCD